MAASARCATAVDVLIMCCSTCACVSQCKAQAREVRDREKKDCNGGHTAGSIKNTCLSFGQKGWQQKPNPSLACEMEKKKGKRAVEVIEFHDPTKAMDTSAAQATRRTAGKSASAPAVDAVASSSAGSLEEDTEHQLYVDKNFMKLSADEVLALGATQLSRREKKKYEQEKLQALGAKPAKNPKVPFRIKMGMSAKQQERERKAREQVRAVLVGVEWVEDGWCACVCVCGWVYGYVGVWVVQCA